MRDTYSIPMLSPIQPTPSRRLVRAAQAERAELAKRRARLQAERDDAAARVAELDHSIAMLDDHERLVARFAGPAEESPAPGADLVPADVRQLKGPEVRRVAVALLAADPTRPALHYRDWYQRLVDAGYTVAGKDGLAVFLTQLSRSPVVRRSTQAGVYEIDFDAVRRLELQRGHLEREMRELLSSKGSDLTTIRARRQELTTAVGQVERALEEARELLSSRAPKPAATSA
jgi:hypothetical protein